MSIINDKKNIFTNISALTSLKDQKNKQLNSIKGVNNSKEILPFLLDLSTTLVGSDAFFMILGNLFSNFIRNIEPDLKDMLIIQMSQYNSDQQISTTAFNSGFTIPISQIDVYDKLKTDPNSKLGLSIYDTTVDNFDSKVYSAIVNPNSDITYLNIVMNYDEISDSLTINALNNSQTIYEFIQEYVCGLMLINEKEFITEVLNEIYGIKTSNQNKTVDKIKKETELNLILEKLSNNSDDLEISESEQREIDDQSLNLKNGVAYIDLGCGYEANEITLDILSTTISAITTTNDPYSIGNNFNLLIDSGSDSVENNRTKKDNFLKRIIKAIQKQILNATTLSPQMRTLNIILSGIKNNGDISSNSVKDDINNNTNLFKCLSKRISSMINEFIFNFIKKELQEILIPVAKKIAMEKLNQYLALIKSLVKF